MSFLRRLRSLVPDRAAGAAAGVLIGPWAHAALAVTALIGLTIGGRTDALVSINPATGTVPTIGSGSLPVGLTDDASALDSGDGEFFHQTGGTSMSSIRRPAVCAPGSVARRKSRLTRSGGGEKKPIVNAI